MKKRMALLLAAIMLIASLAGCMTREADKVNHNMNVAADNFSCERRITVYNARTDKIILYAEGYMSISNNSSSELVVTCKVGANEYKKNYIYLNDYTLYVVEDITGTHADPYHYVIEFHTEFPVNVDVKP
nr:MAG TPA: ABC-type Fe3+ transport system, periplasmic binding protein [Caudoviricetes sp.]